MLNQTTHIQSERIVTLEAVLRNAHAENERLRAKGDHDREAAYREGFRDAERAMDVHQVAYVRERTLTTAAALTQYTPTDEAKS